MATITENLKKILSAVYGKDVRQAIHDSIDQCNQKVSDVYSVVTDIVNRMSLPVKYDTVPGKIWYLYTTGHPGMVEKVSGNSNCECAAIPVESGETYYIIAYQGTDASVGVGPKVMFATKKDSTSYQYVEGYTEPNYGDNGWMVTVPESASPIYLLVYSTGVVLGGIAEVQKMRI